MSSGDSLITCTVCGRLGHWESSHAGDAEQLENLRSTTKVLLDCIDYTNGNCKLNDMVGAVLPSTVIREVRKFL